MSDRSITSVSDFDSDLLRRVEAATIFVNAFAIDHAGGRPVQRPTTDQELAALATATVKATTIAQGDAPPSVDLEQARRLTELAHRLRPIIEALIESRYDDAEEQLNELLRLSHAVPHVHTTSMGMQWFLHFHTADAQLANAWSAGCAVGLAYLLSIRQVVRLGSCAADACDRVFLDLTKNQSRRFCSTACQNRVKAANHRKRQAHHDH
jgi:predicted RNA-binding Zn ribbon-like protein